MGENEKSLKPPTSLMYIRKRSKKAILTYVWSLVNSPSQTAPVRLAKNIETSASMKVREVAIDMPWEDVTEACLRSFQPWMMSKMKPILPDLGRKFPENILQIDLAGFFPFSVKRLMLLSIFGTNIDFTIHIWDFSFFVSHISGNFALTVE